MNAVIDWLFIAAMQPQASSPLSENRFFRGGNMIYKVKIRCCSSYRQGPFPILSFQLVYWWHKTGTRWTNLQTAMSKHRFKKKNPTPAFTHDFLSFFPLSSEDSAPETFNKLFIIPKCWWKEGCASGKSGNRFSSILSTPWKHFSLLLLLLQTSYAYVNQAKHQINLSSCGCCFTLIQSPFYSSNMFGNP